MKMRARIARIMVAGVAALALATAGIAGAQAAFAAGDSVSITSTATTVASNTLVTYTLTVGCSTNGGCDNAPVTFPTTALTGDGATTDFGSWVTNSTCTTLTKTAGQVSISWPSFPTGTKTCIFTMRAPNKTTQNGAVATITPTFTTSAGAVTGTPVTLTSTAGYNASLGQGINHSSVIAGAPLTLTFTVGCGSTTNTGDIALGAFQAADVLPANFTFQSLSTAPAQSNLQGTITVPAVGSSGGTVSYSGNGADCLNPNGNRIVFTVQGTASTAGVADPVGATICNAGSSASFTYSDGHQATATTPPQVCATVTDINFTSNKTFASKALGNLGQYTASNGTVISPYTFPGDWDQSGGDTSFTIGFATNPGIVNGGLSYAIQDPLPCLDTVSGVSYLSNAPGTTCANPAFVPKTISATGFAPSAADLITLRLANGTTQTVAYAGAGWTLPNVAISEIDLPAFDEQGSNSVVGMSYVATGYAAQTALPGRIITNTATVSAVLTGTTTAVKTPQTRTASILVADAAQGGDSGTVAFPSVSATQVGSTCVESVTFSNTVNSGVRNQIEITAASSQAIYLDYLAPVGAGAITGTTMSFTLVGQNGHSFTVTNVVPTQTANYNGTGRTHLEWVIPAGSITIPGVYTVQQTVNTGFRVTLPAGCAGIYHNTLTMGYGTDLTACIFHTASQNVLGTAPMAAPGDPDLENDGAPTQYCGYLANVNITPNGQGFGIDKTVQGDGDTMSGTIGKVSPTNGSATYTVTFSNSGGANLHDAVMYDILPAVGDTNAKSLTPRGSDFPVHLNAVPAVPAGVTVSYSLSANPCRPEVLATNPGCTNDWTTTAPASLSTVKALKFEYLGTVGVTGSAVSSITATYTVSVDPSATIGQSAWNTVGGTARIGDSGDDTTTNDPDMPASESSSTQLSVSTNSPEITKTGSVPTFTAVGDAVTYTFDVTNNQTGTITGVGVTDAFTDAPAGATAPTVTCDSVSLSGGGTAACTAASTTTLAPGDVAHFTATYDVTQGDLDHGLLKDVGTVVATTAGSGQISNTSNIVTTNGVVTSSLTLGKTADVTSVSAVGDPINYSFLVTNTGNQTLSTLLIDDPMLTAVDCPVATLAPSASTTCTAGYATTQADLDAGDIENTATADATGPAGQAVASPTSSVTVTAVQTRQLTLAQTASAATVHNAGDVVTFSFHVTNVGNVTVTGLAIADATTGAVTCPVATLAPGDDEVCTVDYTVTGPDLAAGSITSTGTASGDTLASVPVTVTSNSDTAAVAVIVVASLTLTKTADVAQVTASGQTVNYSFHIVNTGQVALTGVAAVEQTFTGTGGTPVVTCPAGAASLAAGDDVTCTASYTLANADLQLSTIGNTAVATGVSPAGSVSSAASTADVTVDPPVTAAGPVGAVLAFTGATGLGRGIATGLALLGIGVALFVRRRRRNA